MDPFLGQIIMFGGNFAPRSWAFCDGQLLAISQNTALFSILGTTYGGDGRTTFGLPDLRGRTPIHAGQGPGLGARALGSKGGSENTTLNISQMPTHSHGLMGSSNPADQKASAGGFLPTNGRGQQENLYASAVGTASTMGNSVSNNGSGQPFNNMQPYGTVNYIIALQGVFPSRS